jgi:hypothetical protein
MAGGYSGKAGRMDRIFGIKILPLLAKRRARLGMQNSGLGAALAKEHFAHMPLVALPCAISATFHSVIGSLLAGIWRLRPVRK